MIWMEYNTLSASYVSFSTTRRKEFLEQLPKKLSMACWKLAVKRVG